VKNILDQSDGLPSQCVPESAVPGVTGGDPHHSFTDASPVLWGGVVLAGFSVPEEDAHGSGGFVVLDAVTEEQLGCLAQIYTGQLGGMPWEILGTTYEVAGVVRADIEMNENGIKSGFQVPGVGQASGTSLKNPVTGEEHGVAIVLDTGFIWKRGDCGQGSFEVEAEGIHLAFQDTNWILYDFDWSN